MIATYTPTSRGTRRVRIVPLLLVFGLASCALTDGAEEKPSASASASASSAPSTRPAAVQSPADPADPFAGAKPGFAPPGAGARVNLADGSGMSREERAVQTLLDRTLPEFNFKETPLTGVVDHLRDVTSLNIFVDWVALEAAGIDRNTPVTARLRDVKFSKALQILLDQVGGGDVQLGYAFDGNVMTVSTADVLARQTVTKVYDIRDLIIDIPDFTDAPDVGAIRPVPDDLGPPAQPEPKPKPQTRPADGGRSRAELIESITTLVQETVDPDSWRHNGGTVGAIRELQGQLIITQTQDNHRQVVRLLEQLRETRAIQVIVVTRYITVDPSKLPEAVRQKLGRGVDGPGDAVSQLFTEEEELALLQAVQAVPGATVVTAPRISLFNGQRAYVRTAYSQAYVSGYRRTGGAAGEGGQARYEPERSEVSSGVLVDIAATASADRKHVRLNFHPKFATVGNLSKAPWVGPPDAPKDLMVEVPHVHTQEIQTIVMVPDRHTMVMAGLGAKAREGEDEAAAAGQRHYVLVKPTLIGGK
jgi:type II secretory pathway component GspD/PulD (secretin)